VRKGAHFDLFGRSLQSVSNERDLSVIGVEKGEKGLTSTTTETGLLLIEIRQSFDHIIFYNWCRAALFRGAEFVTQTSDVQVLP
jgi:hypothetical protein